jgi:hypothetical protein
MGECGSRKTNILEGDGALCRFKRICDESNAGCPLHLSTSPVPLFLAICLRNLTTHDPSGPNDRQQRRVRPQRVCSFKACGENAPTSGRQMREVCLYHQSITGRELAGAGEPNRD